MKYINSVQITDIDRLRETIDAKGLRIMWLCENSGVPYINLKKGLEGKRPFTIPEAYALAKILGLSKAERDSIFFANKVD